MDEHEDAAETMKARLRDDLRAALKGQRPPEAKLIRALIAAIDNAEAPPAQEDNAGPAFHRFRSGSAEVERLLLDHAQVRQVLLTEIREREIAAAELERLAKHDRAAALRAEILIAQRYVA